MNNNKKKLSKAQKDYAKSKAEVDKIYAKVFKPKPKPGKVRKRYRDIKFEDLTRDVVLYIFRFLDTRDIVAVALTSMKMYKKIWQWKLHDLRHDCHDEIEHAWNSNVDIVKKTAQGYHSNDFMNYIVPQNLEGAFFSTRIKSSSIDSYYAYASWICKCSIFPWQKHHLKVEYVYGPRDVDILSWYKDDERRGYVML